jgi:Flp pilus assembly protein TadG
MPRLNHRPGRRGAIAPLAGFLALFMLVIVSFAVDLSWVALAQSELQNSADAAALAGANHLLDDFVLYNMPNQTAAQKEGILSAAKAAAIQAAKAAAAHNLAGDKSSLTLRDEDIEFGFLDVKNAYTSLPDYAGFPNTVKVKLRRDQTANGELGLYFARAIGCNSVGLLAPASATLYAGVIDSFAAKGKFNVGMLPVTYDVNHWNAFLETGKDPDGNAVLDNDGNPKLTIYPSIKHTGNFGLLSLDDSHAGASEMSDWVHNGLRKSDIDTLIAHKLVPLSAHASAWDWRGDTGFKASLVMDVNNYVGKSFLLPLFQPKDPSLLNYLPGVGKGANFDFNIVAFVGVRIVQAKDINQEIVIQPAAVIEPEAIFQPGSLTPAQPPSGPAPLPTTFTVPKLTQ